MAYVISFIPSKNQSGFTLVELMISLAILSLLLVTGSYSYSMMSERWNKELGHFEQTISMGKKFDILSHLLEGVYPHVVVDSNNEPSFFFIGGEDSLLAVSHYSLDNDGYPTVFRLTSIERSSGKFELVLQTVSTKNFLLVGTAQKIRFDRTIKLFEQLDKISLTYFGWTHLFDKNSTSVNALNRRWHSTYSGINSKLVPESLIVRLELMNKVWQYPVQFQPNPERLLAPYYKENQ
ncbi:prepilin-type N-terminal cleavage/methylation domain-containing protein [Thalassotalea marina]|uniref:Prepilin-type N-terminal cleavage/methylation domain-containing protein n=1 Tax=Thalassotalea marina TaxID=1673741 RepID=A0A919BC88_9GAMM|nr:prepilin-type N-terminal cleavage/methylation domain-containing protein [Thalassotalea marina]GHF80855.1 hypothetical protein GCM10017161_05210 [Thalassotalea marina]